MTIIGIQVVGVLFAGLMLYLTFLHQRRNEFTAKETVFWFGTWAGFLFLVIFPTYLDFFIKGVLGFARKLDFFIVLGFMFLLGILFHAYTIIRKTQNKMEKLVRRVAIERERYHKNSGKCPAPSLKMGHDGTFPKTRIFRIPKEALHPRSKDRGIAPSFEDKKQ